MSAKLLPRWHFQSREYRGAERVERLYLEAEIDCSPLLGDFYPEDYAADPFAFFVDQFRRRYPALWEADAVPIYWSVMPTMESAPFQHMWATEASQFWQKGDDILGEDFLTFYTWPVDDHGNRLDWFSLPVRNDRFPSFEKALGWKPSPLQPTLALRSLWDSRNGIRHPRRRDETRAPA
jgi:hypothetical protein